MRPSRIRPTGSRISLSFGSACRFASSLVTVRSRQSGPASDYFLDLTCMMYVVPATTISFTFSSTRKIYVSPGLALGGTRSFSFMRASSLGPIGRFSYERTSQVRILVGCALGLAWSLDLLGCVVRLLLPRAWSSSPNARSACLRAMSVV